MLQKTSNTWNAIFNKCLKDLKRKYPNKTECQMAKLLGISRATFNRMKNESQIPQIENIIKILVGTNNISFLEEAIDLVDSGLGKKLKSAITISLKEKNKIQQDSRLEEIFENRNLFVTYLLCDKKNGAHEQEIIK